MMQWKGRISAGRTLAQPVISLDLFPTALAVAGVPLPPNLALDGVNLLPLVTGSSAGEAPHASLFWRYGNAIALRRGDWKLVRQPAGPKAATAAFELYNLANDRTESRNLASAEPDKTRALQTELEKMNAEMKPPLW
jgi:arylsulfatase A-like enzyme